MTPAELALVKGLLDACRRSGVPEAEWSVILGTVALVLEYRARRGMVP